ncbi:efflux RND transporter periplasmic adaptor subunit [Lacinutrix mariniflava]|uniref:efflux RND transporter periplasmic adaptor subunit n=1 Tax=Lacinutrix mariniflava TaxID=342955 RepID=UPI0006E28A85|nr:efflux RND transporter periplasmic adaptor subunit [Lacinutrix mariniflava]
MKTSYKIHIIIALTLVLFSCNNEKNKADNHENTEKYEDHSKDDSHDEDKPHSEKIILTNTQVKDLEISVDTISKRNMSGYIEVNGSLGVPPQNEAIITSILGANISKIKVIEGDKVKKGQVVAYISHPDIITMQTDYLQTVNKLTFLEQDFNRQQKLYDAKVASGRDYQQAKSAFSSAKGLTKGYESQLRLLGISPNSVKAGTISQIAPVKSPIDGYIEKVFIKSGQYVLPQTPLMEVVNTEHIHADLMVFEKDVSKVKNGQTVKINVESLGNKELSATIYSVGKSFEEGPKALHIHAEIKNKDGNLIPGMYVTARILTDSSEENALPESAIFEEGNISFVFTAKQKEDQWFFSPIEVIVKNTNNGYSAFRFKEEQPKNTLIAQNGAYYLVAEMKKGEAEHSH